MPQNKLKFDYRIKNTDPHIGSLLGVIDEIKGQFKAGLRMTPQAITSLRKSVLITSAGSSTRIEGSKLTDKEVEKIMQGLNVSKFADRDSQEVQGYLETLQNVFENYQTLPLREGIILSLHKELLKYSTKDIEHHGNYKHKENMVGILDAEGKVAKVLFETTPAYLTGKEMSELVDWAAEALEQNRFHPLLVIANFIIEFLKIHPFEDGNGRLSRILTNLLLLRAGYQFVQYVSHEQIIERRKDEYYFGLRASQATFKTQSKPQGEDETIAPWLNFFFNVVEEQAKKALTYLEEERVEDTLSLKQYEVWKYISSKGNASLGEIVDATSIIRATVRQALLRLVELGKIKQIGRGRATRYVKL
jgi:Fic family protein